MGYEERNRRRKKKRNLQRFMVIFVFIYFLISSTSSVFSFTNKTQLPEAYTWHETIKAKGILIKEEEVISLGGKIENEKLVDEGERVAAGTDIIKLKDNNTKHLEEELKEINKNIEILENINLPGKSDESDEKTEGLQGESLSVKSLDSLKDKKDKLINQLNSNNRLSQSVNSGILSYKLDGLEDTLIPKDFENYTYEKLDKVEALDQVELDKLNGYKIIDNLQWFLALQIEDKSQLKEFDINNRIALEIVEISKEVSGRIIEINESAEGFTLIIKLNTDLHGFYNLRFSDVNIIKKRIESYKIPSKSITNYNGIDGVIVKDFNDLFRFKPIKVLSTEKNYTIVDKGGENGYIKLNGSDEEYRTLLKHDEISINPVRIKENEILN